MVERLFSSRALFRTLALFFRYPEEPLNPRLISRYTGADLKCVCRALNKLEEAGVIRGERDGKYRYSFLDGTNPIYDELRSIFAKTKREWNRVTNPPSVRMWEKQGRGRPAGMSDQGGGSGRPRKMRSVLRRQVAPFVRKCSLTFATQSSP